MMKQIALAILFGVCTIPLAASGDLIFNGGFESYTPGAEGAGDLAYSPVAGWTAPAANAGNVTPEDFLYTPGTATTTGSYYYDVPVNAAGYFRLDGPMPATSPAGGNFLGLAANGSGAPISQVVTGLVARQQYTLGFYWAGAATPTGQDPAGATDEYFGVSFGPFTQYSPELNDAPMGFTGWTYETMTFAATTSSETLTFTPLGDPSYLLEPVVLLDGVTLTAVPEPSPIPMLLASLTFLRRRRRPVQLPLHPV